MKKNALSLVFRLPAYMPPDRRIEGVARFPKRGTFRKTTKAGFKPCADNAAARSDASLADDKGVQKPSSRHLDVIDLTALPDDIIVDHRPRKRVIIDLTKLDDEVSQEPIDISTSAPRPDTSERVISDNVILHGIEAERNFIDLTVEGS
ncbi:hypothetical protein V5O48_009587 [Marasmius crinis-equi]|uniref:Uncharacterized protein n=1 Tax=Marasmius crinis-equi TaxID=585013 RepID=A0ABR3FAN9_9AGAR